MVALTLSACSGGDDDVTASAPASLSVSKPELKPPVDTTSSIFKTAASPAELAAAWPQGFDRHADRLEATVLALGNVDIGADGAVTISPTPALLASGKSLEQDWSYSFELARAGRVNAMEKPGPVEAHLQEASRAHLDYAGGLRVTLEHRSTGLKLFTTLAERPEGQGPLRVDFAHRGPIKTAINAKEQLEVWHRDQVVFHWSGVVAYDANKRPVPVSLHTDADGFWFEVDDSKAAYPLTIDPLASQPLWEGSSTQPGSKFADSISHPGDVNGDGVADIAVSQHDYSVSHNLQGRALVYLGNANGFGNTAGFVVVGDEPNEQLSIGLSISGDANEDGCDELVVGSPGYNGGFGRVLMYRPFECASGALNPSPLVWSRESPTLAGLGRSLSVGDYDCNGQDDLLVGAPSQAATDGGITYFVAGEIQIYHHDATSGTYESAPGFSYQENTQGLALGWTVQTLPDTRGSSSTCDSFAVGTPYPSGFTGAVFIFDHDAGNAIALPPARLDGPNSGSSFGVSLDTMPSPTGTRINGRRIDALVVGAGGGGGGFGSVSIYEWDTASSAYQQVWTVNAPHAGARFGQRIAANGDFNNDGHRDLAVGAYNLRNEAGIAEGGVLVYLGSSSGLQNTPDWTLLSGQAGSEFGISVRAIPDLTGDGSDELLVGARSYDGLITNGGQLFLYPGRANCFIGGTYYSAGDFNPNNTCEVCDPNQSTADWSSAPDGMVCGDESDSCTIATCQAGQCTGSQVDCNDGNPCTQDSCDPTNGCVNESAPMDGTTCEDDGLSCTSNVCEDGACTHPVTQGCLIQESCYPAGATNPSADCFVCDPAQSTTDWSPKAAGTACDNDLFCTINDTCNAVGQCEAGTPRECDAVQCYGGVVCSNAARACVPTQPETGTACDDGDLCTTGDICQAGSCMPGDAPDCSAEGSACATGVCNPQTGACESEPLADGSSCDTGNVCTTGVCTDGVCQESAPETCDDGNPCTVGSCDPVEGCVYDPAPADGAICQAAYCASESEAVLASTCENAECTMPTIVDCAPFACAEGACLTTCDDDEQCAGEAYCTEAGECSTENRAPQADAGTEQVVGSGAEVTLDGTASADPDNDPLTFTWTQIEGDTVTLDDATSAAPIFVAPVLEPGEELTLRFELVVSDGDLDSLPDETVVTVTNDENRPPVAIIEGPSEAFAGESIELSGDASEDPDGDTLVRYQWSLVDGQPFPTISQTDRESAVNVTFPETLTETTTYRFGLIVSDGMANSPRAVHEVVVEPLDGPVEPGPDAGDTGTMPDGGDWDDAGGDDAGPNAMRGTLSGSGCACSSTSQQGDPGFFLFAGLLGLMWWRRRDARS
ncbi:hypothetical protein DL240_02245 [Lujinxingia litoralis]|uniref:PKD domain-containing protein n=1 Tax=Lujinxingia litoralis TaxID=2211119 RepID=A0A328C9B2_9DELT|nr:MYXO-CTERM sorting domain-containing protein [Lujinxingia litoralis]RAL25055.1 hypothetical protein DL240_02245 [Lujinxingia litoralis]